MNLEDYPTPETDAVAEECSEMLTNCGDDIELNGKAIIATASKFADLSSTLERRLALCRNALEYYSNAPWAPYTAGRATNFASIAEKALAATEPKP